MISSSYYPLSLRFYRGLPPIAGKNKKSAFCEALLLFPLWGSPYDYIISGRDMASGIAYNLSRKF